MAVGCEDQLPVALIQAGRVQQACLPLVEVEQDLDLAAQLVVSAAGFRQPPGSRRRPQSADLVEDRLDPLVVLIPADLLRHAVSPSSSRMSHARAKRQSRSTVRGEMPST